MSRYRLALNLTIMVKVLAMVLLLVNHVRILPDPWFRLFPGWMLFLQCFFSALFKLFPYLGHCNRLQPTGSIRFSGVGSTILLAVVSSKAYYGNNKTFCGLMLFLAGLYKQGGPNFIGWQLAITYFGAGLNKAMDADWHSGVFFENWAVHRLHQPWYIALDAKLPPLVLARLMCWTTIITELGTVPCLLIPSLHYWAILANIFFQSKLLLFTGTTFTLFFYAMTAASLAFVTWPSGSIPVLYNPRREFGQRTRQFFEPWDLDGRFLWTESQNKLELQPWQHRLHRLPRRPNAGAF